MLNEYTHVFHSHNEFARGKSHINRIESFWTFCKRRLATFNGLIDDKFILHLKKCEFRFNNRHKNLYQYYRITKTISSHLTSLEPKVLLGLLPHNK